MRILLRKILEVVSGFLGGYVLLSLGGLIVVRVAGANSSGWLERWGELTVLQKVALTLLVNTAVLIPVSLFFWRKRRLVAIGLLSFIVGDLLLGLL